MNTSPAAFRAAQLRLSLLPPNARPGQRTTADLALLTANLASPTGVPVLDPAILANTLSDAGLRLTRDAHFKLEALALRERERSKIVAAQSDMLDTEFAAAGLPVTPVRGWAFARRYFNDPLARHCHGTAYLLPASGDMEGARQLLDRLGWSPTERRPLLRPNVTIFARAGQAEVELYHQPFPWTDRAGSPDLLATPEFQFAELLSAALVEARTLPRRWMIDAVHMLRREKIDAERFADIVRDFGFAGLASAMLGAISSVADGSDHAVLNAVADLDRLIGGSDDCRKVGQTRSVAMMSALTRRKFAAAMLRHPLLVRRAILLRRQLREHGRRGERIRAKLRRRLLPR